MDKISPVTLDQYAAMDMAEKRQVWLQISDISEAQFEAHPAEGWQVPNNLIEDILYNEPATDEERTEVAAACQIGLDLAMPMLVDGIDNDIDEKYVGLPMRLFLVDRGGKIAYAGDKGPFGWDDEGFEAALREVIG